MISKYPLPQMVGVFLISLSSFLFPQSSIQDTTFNILSLVDTINTKSVDYLSNPGFLQLQTGENENLAKNRSAYLVYLGAQPTDTAQRNGLKMVDGLFSSPSYVSIPSTGAGGLIGSYIVIDLQAIRTIKKVKFYTLGGNANLRLRAFTVYAGEDTISMEKVYQKLSNDDANPVADFNPIVARYVKVTIDILASTFSTVISEIEVFGEGYLPTGTFYSSVRNVGKKVNFGEFQYSASVPPGTSVSFSFRSGETATPDSTWSDWSEATSSNGSVFEVYEPRDYFQYRVTLNTSVLQTPVVDYISILYDTLNVVTSSDATISPQYSQILKEQEFKLSITLNFSPGDLGVDTVTIYTPSPANLKSVQINGNNIGYTSIVTASVIKIILNSTITTSSTLDVFFTETPFLAINRHQTFLSSKLRPNNPQRADSKKVTNVENWSIVTVGVPDRLIIRAVANPNPFTPNNDGKNDVSRIEFFLGNVGEPAQLIPKEYRKITIKIYDLNGRLIRELFDSETKAFAYISDNAVEWDGKNDNGEIVRPGVYIYQIHLDTDNGGEQIAKTIVVAY